MSKIESITNQEALEIIEQYKATQQQELLGKLYAPYMKMVLSIGLNYFKQYSSAEDLVMNVYEKLGKKLQTNSITNFSSWLYTVAKNECLMELRKTKREFSTDDFSYQKEFMESEEVLHLFHENEKEQKVSALNDCIQQLKNEQKICVQEFYLNNQSYKEIELKTGLELKKVKSHIQNGKRNLKLCMEKKNGK